MENEEYVAKAPDPVESNPFNDHHQHHREDNGVVGLTGLANLGNTCYMNSALQCLSNVPALTEFFLSCSTLVTKADQFNGVQRDKPNLSQAYFGLLHELWSSRRQNHNSYVPPTKLLYAFKSAHPMFRGYHQQDSQEFLRCFMDQLHEELMEPLNELECHNDEDDDDDHGVQEVELDQNLGSVSETENESVSPDDEEDQEYETADSGVSEESNNSTLNDDVQAPLISSSSTTSTSRKRKRQNSTPKFGDSSHRANNPDEDQLSPSSGWLYCLTKK